MKKLTLKFVFVVLALLASLFMFAGSFVTLCAKASGESGDYITISTKQSNDEVVWALSFGLSTEARGLQENEKAAYRLSIQLMVQKIQDKYKQHFAEKLFENPEQADKFEDGVKYGVPIYNQHTDSAGFELIFDDVSTYDFYMASEKDSLDVDNWLFVITQVKQKVLPFSEKISAVSEDIMLASYFRQEFISACEGLSIEQQMQLYDPTFVYDYATNSNRIKSDSDNYYQKKDLFHHVWNRKLSQIEEEEILTIKLTIPNKGWWYVFGVGVPLLAMTIVIIVEKTKEKKIKKNKNKSEDVV